MKIKSGDIITFKGCVWDDGWNFDAPVIIYEPVSRFSEDGSISKEAVERLVDSICVDLILDGEIRKGFRESDLEEFKWHRWSKTGFKKRKKAIHVEVVVQFYLNHKNKMEYDIIKAEEIKNESISSV